MSRHGVDASAAISSPREEESSCKAADSRYPLTVGRTFIYPSIAWNSPSHRLSNLIQRPLLAHLLLPVPEHLLQCPSPSGKFVPRPCVPRRVPRCVPRKCHSFRPPVRRSNLDPSLVFDTTRRGVEQGVPRMYQKCTSSKKTDRNREQNEGDKSSATESERDRVRTLNAYVWTSANTFGRDVPSLDPAHDADDPSRVEVHLGGSRYAVRIEGRGDASKDALPMREGRIEERMDEGRISQRKDFHVWTLRAPHWRADSNPQHSSQSSC